MAELKFTTRTLLPAAVLILLSVSISAEDAKRCYWCGPLAEQVHRSQRAPSCGKELQETTCDPGYTHCAVVLTAPPYVESRLCMKFYQDECYSLYCNSSKTWRMICPCQGNLCNGQNTDREIRAFATLAKIVGKNKRSKRCLVGVKGFFPITPRKKPVNENNTIVTPINETHSTMHSEEPTNERVEIMETTSVMNDVLEEHESEHDVGNNIEDTKVEQDGESEMQRDQPIETNEAVATTEEAIKNLDETANNIEQSETIKTIDDININSVTTIAMLEENKDDTIRTVTIPAEFEKVTQEITEIPPITSVLPTSIEIELSVVHIKNSNDILPPPEALQQNVTPAKVTAPTTMGTIEINTATNYIETTTHAINITIKNNDQKLEIKKTKIDSKETDEKNGEKKTLVYLWELVMLMNILIYLTL